MKKRQLNFNFSSLTFISSDEEIKKHIINTTIFKYIDENYEDLIELGQLLEKTQYGYTASAQESGNVRLLRISDIRNNQVNWATVPYCECENDSYLIKENDILVARTGGTTGKSFCVDEITEDTVFASYLIRLTANNKVNHKYIMLFLNSYIYWNQIFIMKSGSAQPNVNAEKLKKLLIPFCGLDLQQKFIDIANNLETNNQELKPLVDKINQALNQYDLIKEKDNLTENNSSLVDKLRQSILQEAVKGKLVPQDSNDEPASELLKKIKAEKEKLIKEGKIKKENPLSPIKDAEIPYDLTQGWEWVRLANIGQINPRNYEEDEKEASFVPMTLIKAEYGAGHTFEKRLWKDIKSGFTHFAENDISVAKITPCFENGKSAVMKNLINGFGAGTTELHIFRGNIDFILPEYVLVYFKSPSFLKKGEENMTGTAGQKRVPKDFVALNPFPLPPLEEQKRIVEKVDELMALCDELENQIKESKQVSGKLMQAVLQEVFSKDE